MMFKERKVAQIAAYFLQKEGGRMSHLKLMKLLYLADRETMRQYGMPMTGDKPVSMPHGPVLSMTLNLMDGDIESAPGGWEEWISDKENHEVSVRKSCTVADLDELSPAEVQILDSVWQQFGYMGKWQIRDYTHQHCPEWQDPQGSSYPIAYSAIFRALGRNDQQAAEMEARIESERQVDELFADL